MSDNSWRFNAQCAGRIAEFSVDALGHGAEADAKARALCAGCPMYMACAADAYAHPDHNGVVAAGRVIRAAKSSPLTDDNIRRELAELLDVEFVPARDAHKAIADMRTVPCRHCGHPTVSLRVYDQLGHPAHLRARRAVDTCSACRGAEKERRQVEAACSR